MKKKSKAAIYFIGFICTFVFVSLTLINVAADTGPKPDTEITITNLDESDYIVAYATKYESYFGPHHSFIPNDETFGNTSYGKVQDLTLIYNNVELMDGWYLSDISKSYTNTKELVIKSGYYWPDDFILIIYDKLNDKYYLSEETTTYAFHSYFEFDMNDYDEELNKIVFNKSYDYSKEILQFFIRLFITLLIEMLFALLFRFNKKSLIIILIVNAITQIGLNVGLNLTAYYSGKHPLYVIAYIFIEILIIIFESILYKILCRRGKQESRKWIITYTMLANILSFSVGVILWFLF